MSAAVSPARHAGPPSSPPSPSCRAPPTFSGRTRLASTSTASPGRASSTPQQLLKGGHRNERHRLDPLHAHHVGFGAGARRLRRQDTAAGDRLRQRQLTTSRGGTGAAEAGGARRHYPPPSPARPRPTPAPRRHVPH